MSRNVTVTGDVQYREGDGPMMRIRRGLCEIEETELDVTFGWQDGNNRLSAVILRDEFDRLNALGALRIEPEPEPGEDLAATALPH